MLVVAVLVLLHAPDGHEIVLNSAAVTSMHSAIPGEPNKAFTAAVECLINTSDGKFVSVVESCDKVRDLVEGKETTK
jgi:hypothetical protein